MRQYFGFSQNQHNNSMAYAIASIHDDDYDAANCLITRTETSNNKSGECNFIMLRRMEKIVISVKKARQFHSNATFFYELIITKSTEFRQSVKSK